MDARARRYRPNLGRQVTLDYMHGSLPRVIPGTVSFVDARDVAAAAISAAEKGRRGERYLAAGRHYDHGGAFECI